MTSVTPGTLVPLSDAESHYGIKRMTIDQFEYGGYRYTNLQDAITEARRREPTADGS